MRAVIAGGGVAGLEALIAIRDLAGNRVELTLVAPEPDFVYRPLAVEEPFYHQPAERRVLEPVAREFEAKLIAQPLVAVDANRHEALLGDGRALISLPSRLATVVLRAAGEATEREIVARRLPLSRGQSADATPQSLDLFIVEGLS